MSTFLSIPFAAPLVAVLLLNFAPGALAQAPAGLSETDWAGIREARERDAYSAKPFDGGFRADNPGQGWKLEFDGRGFLAAPRNGSWSWGLELEGVGFGGHGAALAERAEATASGARVTYAWGESLEEWFINDGRGLEHGYTLQQRPVRNGPGELVFTLAVRGGLQPQEVEGGRALRFLHGDGSLALTYSGLVVFDADGVELDAQLAVLGDKLRIRVDEQDARYPITIDPTAQQAYLKASNTDALDNFGKSVSISGDTVVIGATLESSDGSSESDNSLIAAGAAYVFVRNGQSWTQEAYLKASNPGFQDIFGDAVAISGDRIVVGAPYEDGASTGINSNQADNSAFQAGAAYVFKRTGTTWVQEAYLKPSHINVDDQFGFSVAIAGDFILVGAPREDGGGTGTVGDPSDNTEFNSGGVFVFKHLAGAWVQDGYLKPSNPDPQDSFGTSVAIDGVRAIVGAPGEDSNATSVDGDPSNNSAVGSGAAFTFVRAAQNWKPTGYLKTLNADTGDTYGQAVGISGTVAVVGAPFEDGVANGVNGDHSNNGSGNSGAVYTYTWTGTLWEKQDYIKASNSYPDARFGVSLAISGDLLLVGASGERSLSTGVNGSQTASSALHVGAAYLFREETLGWSQEAYMKASNAEADDYFGSSVAISGDGAVVGAHFEQSAATGVNGNQADNSAAQAGAAYVFAIEPSAGTAYCFGDGTGVSCPCSDGAPGGGCASTSTSGAVLTGNGDALLGADSFSLSVSGIPGAKAGLCVKGSNMTGGGLGSPAGDGLLCHNPELRSQVIVSDASGSLTMSNWRGQPFSVFSGTANIGAPTYYQWWYRDPTNTCTGSGFNFSNGWSVSWQ